MSKVAKGDISGCDEAGSVESKDGERHRGRGARRDEGMKGLTSMNFI
jgi:hypothetical protein